MENYNRIDGDSMSAKHNFLSFITCLESEKLGVCAYLTYTLYTPSKL